MAMILTEEERKLLAAYASADKDYWATPWASDMKHGLEFELSITVARRLCSRKLLEGDEDRGKWRGYSITAKGREVLAAAEVAA